MKRNNKLNLGIGILLLIGVLINQAEAKKSTDLNSEIEKYIKYLHVESVPLIIENTSENIQCHFTKGRPDSFLPYDAITIDFAAKSKPQIHLKNEDRLTRIWSDNMRAYFQGNPLDRINVMPEDCSIYMERIQRQINDKDQLVLKGQRSIAIYDDTSLIERYLAVVDLGRPLHGNRRAIMQIQLGKAFSINLNRSLPEDLNRFTYLIGTRVGGGVLHPRAASYVGLQCHESNTSAVTLTMDINTKTVAELDILTADKSFSTLAECESVKKSLFTYSEQVDPKNNGELVTVVEDTKFDHINRILNLTLSLDYQGINFSKAIELKLN